ncbi:MAG TPA: hypothetical protein VK689_14350, partial [Armatimonadota bacterium]|nr:hypothetical protein [Armatimonadota bacterium]
MPHNDEPDTSTWSAGFRLSGQRELSADERREVGRQAQACAIRGCGWLLLVPTLFGIAVAATVVARQYGPAGALMASIGLLLVALGTPALLLMARDSLRWWRVLARDAREGVADRFEGRAEDSPSGDTTLRRLRRMGLLQDYRAETQWFEVLARSGMVWRVNGARPPRLVRAGRARVADVPKFAAVAAQWLEPLDRADRDAPHLGQRELSGAENAELRRHLRRM